MEYGIDVEIILEDYTSQKCSICGAKHKNGRVYRGLYICIKTRKIESYLVTHNGVKPLIPLQRLTPEIPA